MRWRRARYCTYVGMRRLRRRTHPEPCICHSSSTRQGQRWWSRSTLMEVRGIPSKSTVQQSSRRQHLVQLVEQRLQGGAEGVVDAAAAAVLRERHLVEVVHLDAQA